MPKCNCKKDKCLSPAVLQINNHDCPTVFHKVTFPAAMGDDETNPPRNGQYRNVLLVYEANGHVYMFSSDGIPTLISDGSRGIDDYNELTNKPSIEGHELVDDSSLEDIGVMDAIEEALEDYTPTSDLAEVAFTGDYDDLIGTPAIPTQTSDLTNDGSDGTSTYVEADQLATVATSGSYNDLSNKPTIPAAQVNSDWDAASGVAQILNKPSLATVATSGSYNDLTNKPTIDFELVEMSYGESNAWAKFIAAYQGHKIVYCRASSNSNPATGSQTRKAFMAYVNNAENPTEVEFQYVRSVSTKTSSQPVDQVFVYKLTSASGGTWTVQTRDMGPKLAQGTNTTVSYSNGTYTISATQPTVPTKTSDLTNDGSDGTSTYVEADELAAVATTGAYSDLSGTPSLATVATTGDYDDLTNKPTIPTVNDATLTIQRNGTNVQTFTANASSNVTANISVPTKTSDLTNDGSDNTSTYIETDDAQKFAIGQGSTNPVFDEMTPVKTIEWDVTDQAYRPIYQMANTGWTYINMDITVAYRITVTGTNIHSVTDIVDRWHNPISYPITSMFCRTLSASGATTGLRYLRAVYPVSAYLNNASYPLGTEIAMYNATARHVKIEVFKDNSQVTWNTTKPSGPIYVSSTYNNNNVMSAYDTRGWRFRQPAQMYASNAGYAEYISNYEPVNTAASELKNGATALAAGHYAFLADDGLVYDISNTAKNISMCESKVGLVNSGVAANAAISYTYWRAISRPNATQVGYISHDTFALGNRVFLRCTMDSSGNVHSDNYLSTTMSAGYTWMPFGWARSATTLYVDTRFPMFYTLDANGKLTHINGKEVAGSGAASVAWGDITGKPTFATVATSGSYNDLTDKPVITDENYLITATSFSGSDGAYTFTADRTYAEIEAAYRAGKHLIVCADIYRVPDSGRPSTAHEYLYAELSRAEDSGGNDGPTFAFLATTASGSGRSITIWSHNFYIYGYAGDPYNAYSVDNASITVTDIISNSQNPISSNAVYTALATKANTSSLSTVATSGSYNDLSNKPTIPTVNNATLTIQKNGTSVGTFTANASSNVTADISVPTLYTTTGQNTDGAVTQKLFTDTVGNVETILQTLNNGGGAQ